MFIARSITTEYDFIIIMTEYGIHAFAEFYNFFYCFMHFK